RLGERPHARNRDSARRRGETARRAAPVPGGSCRAQLLRGCRRCDGGRNRGRRGHAAARVADRRLGGRRCARVRHRRCHRSILRVLPGAPGVAARSDRRAALRVTERTEGTEATVITQRNGGTEVNGFISTYCCDDPLCLRCSVSLCVAVISVFSVLSGCGKGDAPKWPSSIAESSAATVAHGNHDQKYGGVVL